MWVSDAAYHVPRALTQARAATLLLSAEGQAIDLRKLVQLVDRCWQNAVDVRAPQ